MTNAVCFLYLHGTTTGDEAVALDHALDHTQRIVKRAVHLV